MYLLVLLLLSVCFAQDSPIIPSFLQCEHLTNPLGIEECIDTTSCLLRFQWQLTKSPSDKLHRGTAQYAYQVRVLDINNITMWDSGFVPSSLTFNVLYKGKQLTPGSVYNWTVRVIDDMGKISSWADFARFSTGLTSWAGSLIGMKSANKTVAPWFRSTFQVSPRVFPLKQYSVLAYIGSIGYHDGYINGRKISENVLNPSISYLKERILYRVYDVTSLINSGTNSFAIWAAGGWGLYPDNAIEKAPALIAEIHGPSEQSQNSVLIKSDSNWKCSQSTTLHIGGWSFGDFGGDLVDDRLYIEGWNSPNFDDSEWENVTEYSYTQILSSDIIEPTVRESIVLAKSIAKGPTGFLVEMEDVFTGLLEVRNLIGKEGATVNFSISTHDDAPVEFNMRNAYIFNSSGKGNFRQQFSYHEIQYITITGINTLNLLDVIGYRTTGNWSRAGNVTTSSDLLNKIYETTINNYRGLILGGYSVDCPHRERMGYGGDAHTSFEFAMSQYKASGFFTKWARDFADVQNSNGWVPHTAPTIEGGGGPAWSGFVMTLPWQLYLNYGDLKILGKMYPHMIALLNFYEGNKQSDGLLHPWITSNEWYFLGDWITPHGSEDKVVSPENLLFNNCYLHYITRITANVSIILGMINDTDRLEKSANDLFAAINKEFYNPGGYYIDLLQTHLTMPLATGSVPSDFQDLVLQNLEKSITVKDKGHLDTGLTGTYFMTKFLQENHRNDLVYLYASQTTFPGYGWFLAQGYTTWPEDWGIKNSAGNSKIHGCYNSIGMWFMKGVLGIQQSPIVGFPSPMKSTKTSTILVRSGFDCGSLTSSTGSLDTIFGKVESSWNYGGSVLIHNVTVPINGVALVQIPGLSLDVITESGVPVRIAQGVTYLGVEKQYKFTVFHFQVGSGQYFFNSVLPK